MALGTALTLAALCAPAIAAPPEFIFRIGDTPGSGAGDLDNPRAIATNPEKGHLFVADRRNARVSEYTAWGLFVKAWGWDVAPEGVPGDTGEDRLETCGPPAPEEAPDPTLCQKAAVGAGSGQMALLTGGIEVDDEGNIWVGDLENLRVQKFTPAGDFLLMFGGDVNKTKAEEGAPAAQRNVCPVDPADACQSGTAGSGPSQLTGTVGNYIAYSPAGGGAIVVGGKDRIQVFDLAGAYREEIAFTGPLAAFAGKSVNALDVDSVGNIYFSVSGTEDVYKLDPGGIPLAPGKPGESKFDVKAPLAVTVDHDGNVYAIEDEPTLAISPEVSVVEFDAEGNRLVPTSAEEAEGRFFPEVPFQGPALNGIATNLCQGSSEPGNLYVAAYQPGSVASVDAYGSGPVGCEPPPARPPEIAAQYSMSVGTDTARLQADINPRFWDDTTYYVEYGEGQCSTGGCPNQVPIAPTLLTELSINKALKTAPLLISGLEPGTTYRYRFVAQSGGGGPVVGEERSFTTFDAPTSVGACPNDAFRLGAGAWLPDCRAYEMVSPLDKGGGDAALWEGKNARAPLFFELHQSAPSGERFAFSSPYPFGDPKSAPYISQYLAERRPGGWASVPVSPPRSEIPIQVDGFANEFRSFSADLCKAWLTHNSVATLADEAIERYPNLYRRENCAASPSYEALTIVEPPNRDPDEYTQLRAQGASADGTHAIFVANDALHPDAPAFADELAWRLYESTPTELRFVCYLPNGNPSSTPCAAGLPVGIGEAARNAISDDGERIFWTAFAGTPPVGNQPGAPGQIYVRIGGTQTVSVSRAVAPDPAWYWSAAADGSKAIFEFAAGPLKDHLYEFDVGSKAATLIAKEVEGPLGASEDASRVYFASTEDLDSGGPGTDGAHNLYLYEAGPGGGTFTYVMALADADIGGTTVGPRPIDEAPFQRAARVSPDGLYAVFSSLAPPPNGYDNQDAVSGQRVQEVYRYDAAKGELRCVSCNPTGGRPLGQQVDGVVWAAARIQGWESLGHAPRLLSHDGSRVFFESIEALAPRDGNGTWDVYQWEAPGSGTCTSGSPSYGEEAGGCVDLISSGESVAKSTFLDADPSGRSVFIATGSSLVEADYGQNDVYVARVEGGFPKPRRLAECEGDACQPPAAVPTPPTPASSLHKGSGNFVARKPRRCGKGQRRVRRGGKVRCVKKPGTGKRRPRR